MALPDGVRLLNSLSELPALVRQLQQSAPIEESVYRAMLASLQGATGLLRPKPRTPPAGQARSKGRVANRIERTLAVFDQKQMLAALLPLEGIERIRGIAGSGKTVVLAMRAAMLHLREPEKLILYTFSTKSLYQHVKRLVTRFYRQFIDRDPDWTRLHVLHAWGGHQQPGVYFNACSITERRFYNLSAAALLGQGNAFGLACSKLMEEGPIPAMYDYILLDEGQDFPPSFYRLCRSLVANDRLAFAYDEFQNIFELEAPSLASLFGEQVTPTRDTVLRVCYRNPREVLVCAHSVGLGVYGDSFVQLPENAEHWGDLGYEVERGPLSPGQDVCIRRPESTSPLESGELGHISEIVQCNVFNSLTEEVASVVSAVREVLAEGLRPEDILVMSVDDIHSKIYLQAIEKHLAQHSIPCQSAYGQGSGLRDFSREGRVTLSTVYKSKGNEAMIVFVVGVDACYPGPDARDRNKLFAAMTRAKGWLRMSGLQPEAIALRNEVGTAIYNYPYLKFRFPTDDEVTIMRRDLAQDAASRQKVERLLDEALEEVTETDLIALIEKSRRRRRQKKLE